MDGRPGFCVIPAVLGVTVQGGLCREWKSGTIGIVEAEYRCPICHEGLTRHDHALCCVNHHTFNIARQGYVDLSRKQKASGDNRAMVQARTRFLEQGYYRFLRDELTKLTADAGVLVDIGCGQGWYTKALGGQLKYGFDLSRQAIRHAAGQDKGTHYAVAGIYDLPLADGSADVVTSIFTPLPEDELQRVIRPGGSLIQVMPGPDHLLELKELAYETAYRNPDKVRQLEGFEAPECIHIQKTIPVSDVWDLFEMTPYRYHTPKEGLERVKRAQPMEITFDFVIARHLRKEND
ncbi:putative RNA methyltransferase [Faecalibaculum rodentium]|uniref:putative RNA methyltransferase n=1 Tax=Faecalibaculum rodentium TaxID=1702221 RepID=UPI0011A19038